MGLDPRAVLPLGTAALGALAVALPSPAASWGIATSPSAAPGPADPVAVLVAVLALIAWALAGYLLVLALLTLAGRWGGAAGRGARLLLGRVAPVALRRLMATALGAGLVVGGAGAAAASPGPAGATDPATLVAAAPAALDWPDLSPPPEPTPRPTGAAVTPLDWPAAESPTAALPPPTPPAPTAAAPTATSARVTVRAGDTLWSVAAAHLPVGATDRQVAQAWPSWWAANREVVGDDPGLLRPGQQLNPPAGPA